MAVAVSIDPAQLIELSKELATHHAGPGRPRVVWLRRSVSAAYYATFHAIGLQLAKQLLPSADPTEQLRVTRSVDHIAIKDVCRWVNGPPGAGREQVQPIIADLQADSSVRSVADIVYRLQEARHLADYDHLSTFDKAGVLTLIGEADFAVKHLMVSEPSPVIEKFLALIALQSKLR